MHIFKKYKSSNSRFIEFMIKCTIVLCVIMGFNFLLKGDVKSLTRVSFKELREDGYIDVLFLGASHTEVGYDIKLIEENTGLNAFNAGTAAQKMQGSYYILKETYETNGVKKVYLDITYTMQKDSSPGKSDTYAIADYIRKYKYKYAFDAFGMDGIVNVILPFLHNNNQIDCNGVLEHFTRQYIRNPYKYLVWDTSEYAGQGFLYGKTGLEGTLELADGHYLEYDNLMSEFSIEYLYRIIEYCESNDIELVFVNLPMPEVTLLDSGDYQIFYEYICEIAKEKHIQYLDFNFIKAEYLELTPADFNDRDHLNGNGAEKFSKLISDILNGQETNNMFYKLYREKVEKNPDGTQELTVIRRN